MPPRCLIDYKAHQKMHTIAMDLLPDKSISVIIPAYDVEKYIGEALESALHQVPGFTQIIVVDDGSTDATAQIIARYNDPRIRYVYQANRGLGPARNAGIELANSEFLYFMDADDVLVDGMTAFIQERLKASATLPDAIFFSAIDFHSEADKRLDSSEYFRWLRTGHFATGRDALLSVSRKNVFPVCAWLYVFSRKLLEHDKPLRFRNMLHEDEIFTPELMLRCGYTIITNKILYRRRVRSDSITTTPASERKVLGLLSTARWWLDQEQSCVAKDTYLYLAQSYRFYRRAIIQARAAGLSLKASKGLISAAVPEFSRFVSLDYRLGIASEKLTRKFIEFRCWARWRFSRSRR